VEVDLIAGTASGQGSDEISGIEEVNGTAFDGSLSGDEFGNTMFGW
jgi:hypothetical protein